MEYVLEPQFFRIHEAVNIQTLVLSFDDCTEAWVWPLAIRIVWGLKNLRKLTLDLFVHADDYSAPPCGEALLEYFEIAAGIGGLFICEAKTNFSSDLLEWVWEEQKVDSLRRY